VNKEVLSFLFKGELPSQDATRVLPAREQKREKVQLSKEEYGGGATSPQAGLTPQPKIVETIVRTERKIGRNEQVTIKHIMSGENKSVKYKQAIPLIEKGDWVLVE